MATSRSTLDARPGLIAEIEEHLNSGSYSMRMGVVGALRVLPDGVGLAGLVRALEDAEPLVRLEAVKGLGALPDATGLHGLVKALEDAEVTVRLEAVKGLGALPDAIGHALRASGLRVSDRLRALQALTARRNDGGTGELKAILAQTVRRNPGTEEARRAEEVLAWMEQQSKLPVASGGEPDRSRDASAADGSAVDRSRDAQAAREPAREPERARRKLLFWRR